MTTIDLRRLSLRQWIVDRCGGQQSHFAEVASVNQNELSSLLKNKSFGKKRARKIEQAASMPDMWLGIPHNAGRAKTGPSSPKESRKVIAISTIPKVLADIRADKIVIIADAEDHENEGDLLMAAQFVTPEAINFIVKNTRGLVYLSVEEQIIENPGLPTMTQEDDAQYGTNFTVSIEAVQGITTSISATDHALIVQIVISPSTKPENIIQPDRIFLLHTQKGGVLVRTDHTETGAGSARMSGLIPIVVICEIINDDGIVAHMLGLMRLTEARGLKIGATTDLIEYRGCTESLLEGTGDTSVRAPQGESQQRVYVDKLFGETHLALVRSKPSVDTETLVCVCEPFSVMDFVQPNSRCSWPLPDVPRCIQQADSSVVVLMHRAGDGTIPFDRTPSEGANRAYRWNNKSYGVDTQVLANLNVRELHALSQPSPFTGLTGFGLEIAGFEEK